MTLTLDPARCAVADSVSYLRSSFAKFRVALHRRFRKAISYIAVVELQKSGMAHLHILVGVHIEQVWISEAWQAVGGGRIVDIRMVDVQRVNSYLSKYLTKDLLTAVPSKKKRISTSRDIRLFAKEITDSTWNWTPRSITTYFRNASQQRNKIVSDIREDDAGIVAFTVTRAESIWRKTQ